MGSISDERDTPVRLLTTPGRASSRQMTPMGRRVRKGVALKRTVSEVRTLALHNFDPTLPQERSVFENIRTYSKAWYHELATLEVYERRHKLSNYVCAQCTPTSSFTSRASTSTPPASSSAGRFPCTLNSNPKTQENPKPQTQTPTNSTNRKNLNPKKKEPKPEL